MADDNAWGNGNGDGRTPSPRREEPPAEYREPREPREQRERADYRASDRSNESSVNPGNNLHVRGLAPQTTEQDLEDVFGKFGRIEKCQVMKDPRTRDSRGFAFVTFEEVSAAEEAMNALNATVLDGRTMLVEKAKRGRARTPTPGQYQGSDKTRGAGGGFRGYDDRRGDGRRDYPPRRYDDRDDRRGGYRDDRDYRRRDDDRYPPRRDDYRRDYNDRPPRRDYDDRDRAPRRDYDRRDEEPRRDRREVVDEPSRRY